MGSPVRNSADSPVSQFLQEELKLSRGSSMASASFSRDPADASNNTLFRLREIEAQQEKLEAEIMVREKIYRQTFNEEQRITIQLGFEKSGGIHSVDELTNELPKLRLFPTDGQLLHALQSVGYLSDGPMKLEQFIKILHWLVYYKSREKPPTQAEKAFVAVGGQNGRVNTKQLQQLVDTFELKLNVKELVPKSIQLAKQKEEEEKAWDDPYVDAPRDDTLCVEMNDFCGMFDIAEQRQPNEWSDGDESVESDIVEKPTTVTQTVVVPAGAGDPAALTKVKQKMNMLKDVFGTSWKLNKALIERFSKPELQLRRKEGTVNPFFKRRLLQRRPAHCINSVPPPLNLQRDKAKLMEKFQARKSNAPTLGVTRNHQQQKQAPQPVQPMGLVSHVGNNAPPPSLVMDMKGSLMGMNGSVPTSPVNKKRDGKKSKGKDILKREETFGTEDDAIFPMAAVVDDDVDPYEITKSKKMKKRTNKAPKFDPKTFFNHMKEAKGQYLHIHPVHDPTAVPDKKQPKATDLGNLTTDREQFQRTAVQQIEARAKQMVWAKHYARNKSKCILQSRNLQYQPLPDLLSDEESATSDDMYEDVTFSNDFEVVRETIPFNSKLNPSKIDRSLPPPPPPPSQRKLPKHLRDHLIATTPTTTTTAADSHNHSHNATNEHMDAASPVSVINNNITDTTMHTDYNVSVSYSGVAHTSSSLDTTLMNHVFVPLHQTPVYAAPIIASKDTLPEVSAQLLLPSPEASNFRAADRRKGTQYYGKKAAPARLTPLKRRKHKREHWVPSENVDPEDLMRSVISQNREMTL